MNKAELFREKAAEALRNVEASPPGPLRELYAMHAIEWHRLAQVHEDREQLRRTAPPETSAPPDDG